MTRRVVRSAVGGLLLAGALVCGAQEKGYWRAASSNANAITGDLSLAETKATIGFVTYPIAEIRKITAEEAAAAFDAEADAGGVGKLYRLRVPAEQKFAHHNTLCGTEETEWMVTYVEGKTLRVAFFSGTTQPALTVDALANSSDVCGIFTYAR